MDPTEENGEGGIKGDSKDDATSPFLNIAPELRNKIYYFAFPEVEVGVEPKPHRRAARALPGILLACKQTHDEAIGFYYASISVHIDANSHHPAASLICIPAKYLDLIIDVRFDEPRVPVLTPLEFNLGEVIQDMTLSIWCVHDLGLDFLKERLDNMGIHIPRTKLLLSYTELASMKSYWSFTFPIEILESAFGPDNVPAILERYKTSERTKNAYRVMCFLHPGKWSALEHLLLDRCAASSILQFWGSGDEG